MELAEQFSDKRILLTGVTGFIGRHLARRLVAHGAEVWGVFRRPVLEGGEDGVCYRNGDLSIIGTVEALFQEIRPDIVFHLASHVAGARGLELVQPTLQSNLVAAVNILCGAAGMESPPRVILAGSMEEPDPNVDGVPSSPYAAAKSAATAYARMFADLYRLPVAIARIFMVYGPDQPDKRKLVPYVIRSLLAGRAPSLTSGARAVDWIYIDDLVDGLLAMALAGAGDALRGCQVDLGTGRMTTVCEVVEQLSGIAETGVEPTFGSLADRAREQERAADTARTEALIGWRSRVSLGDGLRRTFEWYRARGA